MKNVWVKDGNGNRCSIQYFGSVKYAQEALDSLKNCKNCTNCIFCENCNDCINCKTCIQCGNCKNCGYCDGCGGCEYAVFCIDCTYCLNLDGYDSVSHYAYGVKLKVKIPVVNDIHQKVYSSAKKNGHLDMRVWHHECGTKHCRAGWVVVLSDEEGLVLEEIVGTMMAAMMIYDKSSNLKIKLTDFFVNNTQALVEMRRMSDLEKR